MVHGLHQSSNRLAGGSSRPSSCSPHSQLEGSCQISGKSSHTGINPSPQVTYLDVSDKEKQMREVGCPDPSSSHSLPVCLPREITSAKHYDSVSDGVANGIA